MANEINIGIVGAGQNTKLRHIPGFEQIENVNIISVCNRSEQSGQAVANKFKIPKVFTDWKQMVEDDDINAVMIGTWPNMHAEVTIAALNTGKHVLCEARMARNLEEAKKMNDTARAHPELVAQIVPSPFTLAFDKTIIELIENDTFGKILAVDLQAGNSFIDHDRSLTWREDYKISGNNTLSLGIWYEAIMRWLGPAKSVIATSQTFVKHRPDENGNNVEIKIPDHLNVLAEFNNELQANLRFSAVTGMAGGQRLNIFGEKATLCFYQDNLLIAKKGEEKFSPVVLKPENISRWRMEQEFINAIRGTEKVKLTTFEDGLKYMQFTDAVIQSSHTGREVQLNL